MSGTRPATRGSSRSASQPCFRCSCCPEHVTFSKVLEQGPTSVNNSEPTSKLPQHHQPVVPPGVDVTVTCAHRGGSIIRKVKRGYSDGKQATDLDEETRRKQQRLPTIPTPQATPAERRGASKAWLIAQMPAAIAPTPAKKISARLHLLVEAAIEVENQPLDDATTTTADEPTEATEEEVTRTA